MAAAASLLPQGPEGTNSPDNWEQRMPFWSAWFRAQLLPGGLSNLSRLQGLLRLQMAALGAADLLCLAPVSVLLCCVNACWGRCLLQLSSWPRHSLAGSTGLLDT